MVTLLANPDGPERSGPDRKLLLTPEEAAELLGIGRTKCYELISAGALESIVIGRLRRIPRDALGEYVADVRRAQGVGRTVRPGSPADSQGRSRGAPRRHPGFAASPRGSVGAQGSMFDDLD
ncbi:MAG TPA: helix-turn-helix domain-containing protein [Acidimicrobiales bacterium]|nr:helix-turn-helix domain-containing protein [Acidimicrobiales bacterium]